MDDKYKSILVPNAHTLIITREGFVHEGSASQEGPSIPISRRAELIKPLCGARSWIQSWYTATPERTVGR